jgi:hypothetical protein
MIKCDECGSAFKKIDVMRNIYHKGDYLCMACYINTGGGKHGNKGLDKKQSREEEGRGRIEGSEGQRGGRVESEDKEGSP